ncbi:conserved hypothetical protein [Aeromonas phage 65]|uniref:Uncharacterized protein n=1 Tax=Aeromonas phage 65 TaxID=2919549 RepID=E5DRW8_9CAUD|nr:hypothetical protein ST65p134 [Aeromonas phage 65]ADQ53142.1 conserved hypothetical protein [Aeromonas phage 65]
MWRSVEVTVKKFEESHLRKLTKSRIKAFKASLSPRSWYAIYRCLL